MSGPKVVVIGAGSYFFGKPVIHKFATSPHMAGGTLALVDTDEKALRTMMRLAKRVFQETQCGVKLIGDVDRRKVMKDADFVVLTFSRRNAHSRGVDTMIAAKHGMRMCSGDTVGPGGVFRALTIGSGQLDVLVMHGAGAVPAAAPAHVKAIAEEAPSVATAVQVLLVIDAAKAIVLHGGPLRVPVTAGYG